MKRQRANTQYIQWSTRKRLIVVILAVFISLTTIISVATFIIVDQQIDTVTIGRFATDQPSDEQYAQQDSARPSLGGSYVAAGKGTSSEGFAITASRGNEKARNLLLLTSVVPIPIFGTLSAAATWSICTRSQRRVDEVAKQIRASGGELTKQVICIPKENDAASVIADAYNDAIGDVAAAIAREKRFIADASHELKNPLAATAAALEILVHNGLIDDRALPFVEKAMASNASCIALTKRLLDLAKVQQLECARLTSVDMGTVAEDVLASFYDDATFEGLTLHKQIESVSVMGDRLLLTQLVRNLTLNAAQHNVEGGHIWVSTGEHFDVDGRRMSSFDVENTGADLCETNLGDLFAPFNRGRNSRIMEHDMSSRTIGNHGLGLSIAKEIVTLHDGSIRLQARDGGGLRVSVYIPVSR